MRCNKAVWILVGFLAWLGATGWSAAAPLKISMPTWVGNGPLYLAQEKGFYKEEGVEVELSIMDDISMRFAAYYAGQIDGMSTALAAFILNAKPDIPSKVVLLLDDSKGGDGIVANKDIRTISDLKGKRVAFKESSISEWFIAYLLMKEGLSLKDIQVVNMEPGAAGSAFIAKKVDAAVTWEPYLTKGKQAPHGHILIDSSQTPGLISDVLIFPDRVIQARQHEIQGVCRAVVKAIEYWKSHPEESNAIMAKAIGGWLKDPKLFGETLTGIQYYDRAMNQEAFEKRIHGMVADRIKVWKKLGKLGFDAKAEDFYDPSFAKGL
jgi:NitT/TauT family transport system substrate-binding protein